MMCGITGFIDLARRHEPDRLMVRRMAAALAHRGPDDCGFLFAPGLALAHRRLSIVGVGNGRQPIFNEDRSVAVICNGEFFDFPERRTELEAKGHVFRTQSDSELLVHLYEEHGEELFPYLKGQFAFVLIDFVKGIAILARDRVGICPLFWSRQGDVIYFGSEIKALIASGAVRPRADPHGLDHLFTFFALAGRRTAFEAVQAVAPGHYVKVTLPRGGKPIAPVERKYWDFDFPDWGDEEEGIDGTRLIDAFEAAFARAVAIRLRADVPVVGYLSGGVDSAYVLATASRIAGRPLPSFTLRIPGTELDEIDNALESARAIGDRLPTIVEAGSDRITEAYSALTYAAESPVLDTSCAALLTLSGAVRSQGYKVVLTGEGADEAFAGYVWFKIRQAAQAFDIGDAFRPSTLVSRIARKWAAPHLSFAEIARTDAMIAGPHAQTIIYNLVATSRQRYFSAGFKEDLGDRLAYQDLDLDLGRMARWHPLNRSLYLGYKVHLAGLLLGPKGDRVVMANGVEARYPFLDEDVIALTSRLHPRWKLTRRLRDKYLLRQAARRVLSEAVAQRPKHMFRAPLAESFLAKPPQFVRELISSESLARAGYFDVARVRRDCDALAKSEGRGLGNFASLGLSGVVATQLWHHLYLGGDLCSLPVETDRIAPALEPLSALSA